MQISSRLARSQFANTISSCPPVVLGRSREAHITSSAEDSAAYTKELTPDEEDTTKALRDRLQDLPRWSEELTEKLVEPRSTSSGTDRKDPQEPLRPAILPAKAPKVKQRLFMHFPKDPNCGTCKRKKVTRRSSQSHVRRTTEFGNVITADNKVLNEEGESRNNQRYAIVVQDLATQWIEGAYVEENHHREQRTTNGSFLIRKNSRRFFTDIPM